MANAKATAKVKEDGELESLAIAEAPRGIFDPLNLRVEAFAHRVGDVMREVRQDVLDPSFHDASEVDHRP